VEIAPACSWMAIMLLPSQRHTCPSSPPITGTCASSTSRADVPVRGFSARRTDKNVHPTFLCLVGANRPSSGPTCDREIWSGLSAGWRGKRLEILPADLVDRRLMIDDCRLIISELDNWSLVVSIRRTRPAYLAKTCLLDSVTQIVDAVYASTSIFMPLTGGIAGQTLVWTGSTNMYDNRGI